MLYGENELNFIKCGANVYDYNQASIKLHEKMGFKKEVVLKDFHFSNGKYSDEYIYGLTKDEFNRR